MNTPLPYEIGLIAEKLIELDIYDARDNGETKESVIRQILDNPVDIIGYLLEYIDEMQA